MIKIISCLLFLLPSLWSETVKFSGTLHSCIQDAKGHVPLRIYSFELQKEEPEFPLTHKLKFRSKYPLGAELDSETLSQWHKICQKLPMYSRLAPSIPIQGELEVSANSSVLKVLQASVSEDEERTIAFPVQAGFSIAEASPSTSEQSSLQELSIEVSKALPPNGTGYGSYTYSNGDHFVGYFLDYRRHGQGKYTWVNGAWHDGYWESDLRHGPGVFLGSNGVRFEGVWTRGLLFGPVKIFFTNGMIYDGNYSNNTFNGYGTLTWPSGQVYSGYFLDGLFHGEGTMKYANGNRYDGSWQDNLRHGFGTMAYNTVGESYVGTWAKDKFWGKGQYNYQNGAVYNGDWVDGKRHGQGVFFSGDLRYTGSWEHDNAHGEGVLLHAGINVTWKAFWKNGNIVGRYEGEIEFRATQDSFRGVFENLDMVSGLASMYNGDRYEGNFQNGVFHGTGTYTFSASSEFLPLKSLSGNWHQEAYLYVGTQTILNDFDLTLPPWGSDDGDIPSSRPEPAVHVIFPDSELAQLIVEVGVEVIQLYPAIRVVRMGAGLSQLAIKATAQAATKAALVAEAEDPKKMSGLIYLRRDPEAHLINPYRIRGPEGQIKDGEYDNFKPPTVNEQIVLFQYIGKVKNLSRYRCRQQEHIRAKEKLFGLYGGYKFTEKAKDIADSVELRAKEQFYIMEVGGKGPVFSIDNLQNKINAMGLEGWTEYISNPANLLEWNALRAKCFLTGDF
ncbi:MAG: hypothetical protein H3C47_16565 [Candidatus Cloacimonetes bacterium]|nr:hypothetical protein [Candidatus Cloacimonadota bacterium]